MRSLRPRFATLLLTLACLAYCAVPEPRLAEQCRQNCMTRQNQCMLLARTERDIQQCKQELQDCSLACSATNENG